MKNKLTLLTVAAMTVATSVYTAKATPTLFLWDGTAADNKTVVDNGSGDQDNTVGIVDFNGNVGNFHVTADAGTTKPVQGSATLPDMDLSYNAGIPAGTSPSSGTLTVAFFDNAFGPGGLAGALASIGGTFNAANGAGTTLTFQTYTHSGNTAPSFTGGALDLTGFSKLTDKTFKISDGISYSSAIDGSSLSGGANPYSLLMLITINVNGPGAVTGDTSLTAPDGGTTMMLLGSGLAGLGLLRRSFKRKV